MLRKWIFCLCACCMSAVLSAQHSYRYLNEPLPESWPEDNEVFVQTLPVEDRWWKVFEDPTLDSLIAEASERNYSVESAMAHIEQSRMNLRIARGAFFPSLSLGGGWNRQQTSGNIGDGARSWSGQYDWSVAMNWEVDIFGSIRKNVQAQRENYMASQEEYNAVMVSLCSQVATTYFTLRQYQYEREVLLHNCASQKSVMELTEARYQSGLASRLDVTQATSVYYGTLASVPRMEANIIQTMNALSVLLGIYPEDAVPGLEVLRPLPDYIELVGVDLPAALLRRRPDIRSAERKVNAQAALYGASKREWLPKFFLNGSLGFASDDFGRLMRKGSLVWQIAPSFTWTLFNGGARYNTVRLNRAQLDEVISSYNQTVLQAMQEANNAMIAYKNSIKQIVTTRQAFNQSEQALELSLDLYKQGLSPFQNVLDAQRSLLSYQDALVQSRVYSLLCLVQLYEALGGGWVMP